MKSRRNWTRSLIATGVGVVLTAIVLGWFEIPIVSSQGIVIRSHFREGNIPSYPSDKAWEALAPIPIPLSGQIITRTMARIFLFLSNGRMRPKTNVSPQGSFEMA